MMNKLTILYICVDSSMGGSTASLFNLIESIKEYVNPIVLFRSKGVGLNYYQEHGIECHVFPYYSLHDYKANRFIDVWTHPWRWHYIKKWRGDLACVRFVKQFLNNRKLDIVHTNTSVDDIGVLLSRRLHAKHVWHVRECLDIHSNTTIYGGMDSLIKKINDADARIAISSFVKKHWQMPDENTWVIHDAVRSSHEACYEPQKDNYLLFCSYYLTEPKGTRKAIIAFAKSGVMRDKTKLILLGNCDETYKSSLIDTAEQYGVSDFIDFIPVQQDVKPYFIKAKAYIMASQNEGLGRVTAEAMFFGCPVIAFASGGTLDIIKDGETGYLYNNLDECAQLIRRVCFENKNSLILHAQDFVINNLSQEVYGPRILEVYKQVLLK